MTITPGMYETRCGALIAVLEVRPSGFIKGQAVGWDEPVAWNPQGRWLDARSDSPMDLVTRVGDFVGGRS